MKQNEIFKMPPPKDFRFRNPMLKGGMGPEGKRCKTCKYLIVKKYAGKYFKCKFRGDSNGPGTDHRANYQACWKYEDKNI